MKVIRHIVYAVLGFFAFGFLCFLGLAYWASGDAKLFETELPKGLTLSISRERLTTEVSYAAWIELKKEEKVLSNRQIFIGSDDCEDFLVYTSEDFAVLIELPRKPYYGDLIVVDLEEPDSCFYYSPIRNDSHLELAKEAFKYFDMEFPDEFNHNKSRDQIAGTRGATD